MCGSMKDLLTVLEISGYMSTWSMFEEPVTQVGEERSWSDIKEVALTKLNFN